MIKAAGQTGDGTPLVILGLSGENITRLMANEPIMINLADMNLEPVIVTIIGGKTEETIMEQLKQQGLI